MRERDLTNAGSDEENETGGEKNGEEERRGGEGGRERKGKKKKEDRGRSRGRVYRARDARGETGSYVEARTAEVKRNDNGRKSGGHRWMKKQKDIDDGG